MPSPCNTKPWTTNTDRKDSKKDEFKPRTLVKKQKLHKKKVIPRQLRNLGTILSQIKNFEGEELLANVQAKLLVDIHGCRDSKMIVVENLGLGQSDSSRASPNSSLLVTRRDKLVNELKNLFLKHYEDVGNDQLVKNEDKHMEMEKRWFRSLGFICKVLVNNSGESLSEVEDTLLSILFNCSGTQSLSDIVAVFHAIAHSTFDILMKKGLEEETSSNSISDLNNNNPGFIDGDQSLRLISLAGGCLGQMMNNYKEVWNKKTKSNTEFVNFITSITMCKEEKSNLEEALKDRDRGGLLFPRSELNRFLITFERELGKVANKETMKSYGANAIKVICSHMKNSILLQEEFEQAVNNMEFADCRMFELENREPFLKIFLRKMVHARVGAFISSYNQLKVDARKGLSKGGSMLRDDLYGYAKNQKNKKAETRKKEKNVCDKRKPNKPKSICCVIEDPLPSFSNAEDPSFCNTEDPLPSFSNTEDPLPSFSNTEDPLPSSSNTEDPFPNSSNLDLDRVAESHSGIKIRPKAANYLTERPLPCSSRSQKLFMEAECDTQPSCSGNKSSCFKKSQKELEFIGHKSLFSRSKRTIKPRKILDL